MQEVAIKTHLIVTDIDNEYNMNWCGKIANVKPYNKNGKPVFIIVGGNGRMEINTTDMTRIEKCAKLLTAPKGRSAVTSDMAHVYILEENGNEALLGVMTHTRIKHFAPMYDKVGYI